VVTYVKSRILVFDAGPPGPKRVAVIDGFIKRFLCLTVIHEYMPVLNVTAQGDGFH
jgi:hypothetical protein